MQIGSISSGGPGMSVLNPVHFARTAAPAAVVATPIKASSSATTWTVSASTTTSSEVASKGGGGGQAAPASGGASSTETLAAAYSTTVGGKQYSGSVEESGGEYPLRFPIWPAPLPAAPASSLRRTTWTCASTSRISRSESPLALGP